MSIEGLEVIPGLMVVIVAALSARARLRFGGSSTFCDDRSSANLDPCFLARLACRSSLSTSSASSSGVADNGEMGESGRLSIDCLCIRSVVLLLCVEPDAVDPRLAGALLTCFDSRLASEKLSCVDRLAAARRSFSACVHRRSVCVRHNQAI